MAAQNNTNGHSKKKMSRRARLRRKRRIQRDLILAGIAAVIIALIVGIVLVVRHVQYVQEQERLRIEQEQAEQIAEADRLAAMCEYDEAVTYILASEYYEENEEMQSRVSTYQAQKSNLVAWEPEDVTHIFFHTLIVDPSKAFDGDAREDGYNQYMCTISEFNKIMDIMYEKGYMMISMHDMCDIDEDGNVTKKQIMLPEGKIPFVLSQDDVSYYHYMGGDGFAEKLIIDDNGQVKNTYIEDDGTVSVGNYDLVPLIDAFVEEHPDFSYKGHKGTIALTGYEGVLGYRTDEVYRTKEEDRLTSYQRTFFEENPDFDEEAWQNEVDQATAVADAMKEEGWEFASHTWGHIDPLANGITAFERDTDRWEENVRPIVGDTDIIIYAFGADISTSAAAYSEDNEFFQYLKKYGFNIFCDVDSNQYYVMFGSDHMRMGRRNIDGYRMYYTPDKIADLFDVAEVWDPARPSTVPEI